MAAEMTFSENTVELHFYLNDGSHTVDAFAQNKAQAEFLFIAKDIAQILGVELDIEVFPLKEGGIKQLFNFKSKTVQNTITANVFLLLFTMMIVTPVAQLTGELIKRSMTDPELTALQKEKLKAEIENIKTDKALKMKDLGNNPKLIIHKSRFYKEFQRTSKIEKVSIRSYDTVGSDLIPEKLVVRTDFPSHIVESSTLPDINVDHAIIEIVSPVLKEGNIKWRGIYNGEAISFSMHSREFKKNTLAGVIQFSTGFTIDCQLNVKRKLDENGIEKITEYIVKSVNKYYIDKAAVVEMQEGQKQKEKEKKKVMDERQMTLFKVDDY